MRILTSLLLLVFAVILKSNAQTDHYSGRLMSLPDFYYSGTIGYSGAIGRIGKGQIKEIVYSPDGQLLAVASSIGTWLYDAESGKELALLTAHTGPVRSVAFSPDSKTLATVNYYFTIYLWDTKTREHKATLVGNVRYITFSPDGKTLAGSNYDHDGRGIKFWDIESQQQSQRIAVRGNSKIVFSPDGKSIASADSDDKLRLWDIETGKNKLTLPMDAVVDKSIAYSPDGESLACGGPNNIIRIWDPKTAEQKTTLTGHTLPVHTVVFTPDGKTLVSGGGDHTIRLWDINTGENKATLTGHSSAVDTLAISPDGLTLASGSYDGTIQFWDIETGKHKSTIRHAQKSVHAKLSPDGKTLATERYEEITLWDVKTGEQNAILTGLKKRPIFLSFSKDGTRIIGMNTDESLIWDTETGKLIESSTFSYHEMFSYVAPYTNKRTFSPDGNTLASGRKDGNVEFWDTHTRKRKMILERLAAPLYVMEFSPDGNILVVATEEVFEFWDTTTGKQTATYPKPGINPSVLAVSRDNTLIAGGEDRGKVNLWNIKTGEHLSSLGHYTGNSQNDISSLAFSADGRTLATGSMDDTVRLWDTTTGHHMQTFSRYPLRIDASAGKITWLTFSPTEDILFSRSQDGTIHLWDATHIVESDATVSISPSSIKSPAIGEQLTIEVTIADADNIKGYGVTMEYDPTALRYVSSSKGDFVSENASYETKESRRMKVVDFHDISYPHYLNLVSKDRDGRMEEGKRGRLASITYEVIEQKTSTLTFKDVRLEKGDGMIARPRIKDGKIFDPKQIQNTPNDATQFELPKGAIARYGKGRINDIKYSPDNSLLAVSTTIGIWLHKANSGQVLALLKGHTKATSVLAFSPDGELLASGSDDATIRLWDTTTYQSIRTLKTNGYVTAIAFSPNGKTLATVSVKKIQMWHMRTLQPIFIISQGDSTVTDLVFSPDGKSLASASIDDSIKLWDAKTGQLKINFDEETFGFRTAGEYRPRGPKVAFSPDGKSLASTAVDRNGFADKKIKVWNTQTGELQATLEQDSLVLQHPFTNVQFSIDGRTVICCKSDGTLLHWNPKTDETVNSFGEAENRQYTLLPISPKNNTFVWQTKDDYFELWDVETGHLLTILRDFGHAIPPLHVSVTDKQTRVSKLQDNPTDLWKIISPQFTVPIRGIDDRIRVPAVAFSPHSATLVGKSSETVWLWDTNTSKQRGTLKIGYDFTEHAFSPDGRVLAVGTSYLWNVLTGKQVLTLNEHAKYIRSIAFSPDGTLIATAGILNEDEYVIRIWDAKTGENLKTITNLITPQKGRRLPVTDVVFSPDGKMLASIDAKGKIQLWDIDTGKHIATFTSLLQEMPYYIVKGSLIFSPDQSKLVSSSGNSDIYVWDVENRKHEDTLKGHLDSVVSLAYSEDGTTLLSGSTDGTALKWHMQTTPITRLAITPLSVESPPIGRKLTFNVKIIDAENVIAYKFTCKYDSDALRYIPHIESSSLNTKTQVVGKNTILVTGNVPEDSVINDGTIATLTFEIKEPENVTLTITNVLLTHKEGKQTRPVETHAWVIKPELILEDANRDWQVDAADLEFISSRLGQTGKGNSADINEDGIVDIADLVLVRKALYGNITESNED